MHVAAPIGLRARALQEGAKWESLTKTWSFEATPFYALRLLELYPEGFLMDPEVAELLRVGMEQVEAPPEDVLTEIPGMLPAWEHQKRAFHFAKRMKASMLAMGMGTGKSRVAISLLEEWDAKRVLVLCPKSVLGVWPKQLDLHSTVPFTVVLPPPSMTVVKKAQIVLAQSDLARPMIVLINYEASWRPGMADVLKVIEWDAVICDESHRIKSAGGKASRLAMALRKNSKRRLCLTGTPMPHSPLDIYAQYRFLDPGVFGTSKNRFQNRYAIMGGFEGRQVIGYQREEEFAEKVGKLAFIVTKDEALPDLPERQHLTRTFALGPKALRAYNSLEHDFIAGVREGVIVASNALVRLLRLRQVTSGYGTTEEGVEVLLDEGRKELFAEVLEDLPREPVVVFCAFHHDLDAVREVVEAQGLRFGELSGRRRDALTDEATMSPDIDVAGVQLQSGGVGIDLTRSAVGIYYSSGLSLGDYLQSLDRIHRPGQERKVTYIHLLAESTVDQKIYKALRQRKQIVEAVLDAARE